VNGGDFITKKTQLLSHVIASRFLAKQSPIYQAKLTAWGLLRRKERSSQ